MNLDEYRTVFVAASLVLVLIVAAPTVGLIVPFPRGGEAFSELWLLGPKRMAEDYPFNVRINDTYRVFVGVGNHLGISSYYLIYVKFRNSTQPLPNVTASQPSPLAPLYEFRAFVTDGDAWEKPFKLIVLEASRSDDSTVINRLAVNDVVLDVNFSTSWDSAHNGFYFQLFFELWLFNVNTQSFQYHNRFVGIWLNMTAS